MSGFFGGLLNTVEGLQGAHPNTGNMMSELVDSAGGMAGIVDKLNQSGLGAHVQSWIGSGNNLGVAASQIEQVFPPDQLEALAEKHGIPTGMVSGLLAQFLPHAVSQAAADGTVAAAPAMDPGTASS